MMRVTSIIIVDRLTTCEKGATLEGGVFISLVPPDAPSSIVARQFRRCGMYKLVKIDLCSNEVSSADFFSTQKKNSIWI